MNGIVAAGVIEDDDSRHVAAVTGTIGPLHPKGRLLIHITEEPPLPVIVKRARRPRNLPASPGGAA